MRHYRNAVGWDRETTTENAESLKVEADGKRKDENKMLKFMRTMHRTVEAKPVQY